MADETKTKAKAFVYRLPRPLYRDAEAERRVMPIEDGSCPAAPLRSIDATAAAPVREVAAVPIKRGRGRPALANPAPWKAEGVSKATWYARRKREGER
jgi:hypothetical protein